MSWKIPALIGFVVIAIWGFSGYYLYGFADRGTFGDMFGAVNALFSGLAFAGVIYAVLLQRKELELQRNELELTRTELKRSADAAQKQVDLINGQRRREDLYRLISKLAGRINNNYNENLLDNGESIHHVLSEGTDVNANLLLNKFYSNALNTNTKTYRIIRHIENDLRRLKELIQEYESVTAGTEKCTPFPDFYKNEYSEMVDIFHQYNLFRKYDFVPFFSDKYNEVS